MIYYKIKLYLKNLSLFFFYCLIFIILSCILLFYLYITYLRERLPRDIPFLLTELTFYSILFTCIIYLYVIKISLVPKNPNEIFKIFIYKFKLVFYFLISLKKKINLIFYLYENLWLNILPLISTSKSYDPAIIFFVIPLISRIFLLFVFFFDVFFFHKIESFYFFIFLSLIPLIYLIIIYYLSCIVEDAIKSLEAEYALVWVLEKNFGNSNWKHNKKAIHHDTCITIREYIKIKKDIMVSGSTIDYKCDPLSTEQRLTTYLTINKKKMTDLTEQELNFLRNYFDYLIPNILDVTYFLFNIQNISSNYYIKYIKILIIIMYFICWFYILVVSFHTLKDFSFTLQVLTVINKYANIPNPFI